MYEDILLPTDGSDGFENVTTHALEIAEKFDSTVHIMEVVDTTPMMYDVDVEHLLEQIEQIALEDTGQIAEKAEERGITVLENTPSGVPSAEISDYARENNIDLIVMGTHGRTGMSRFTIGSVAEKVVRKAETPVMTCKLASEE